MREKETLHRQQSSVAKMAATLSPEMLGTDLASDLVESIDMAIKAKDVFVEGRRPITIFRDVVVKAITDIEERSTLLRRFLLDGPYEHDGDIPAELHGRRLTDEETSKAITFIYSHVVNSFQGRLAELLAAGPCVQLVEELRANGQLPPTARLYIGDSVRLSAGSGRHYRKAADMHIVSRHAETSGRAVLLGVVEVKSYACGVNRLWKQLARHVARARDDMVISLIENGSRSESRCDCPDNAVTVGVTPATWKIPRTFSFTRQGGKLLLNIATPIPVDKFPSVERIGQRRWRIVLRWSREALASVAYEMTFWYMEKLGEVVYSDHLPPEWSEMTAAEAGRNAAKMMLYYAIRRDLGSRARQRAIALYNTYGFGYTLGMNFRDANGRREMMWPEDLHEIAKTGSTKHGCRIR